jgi:hypothetical protein
MTPTQFKMLDQASKEAWYIDRQVSQMRATGQKKTSKSRFPGKRCLS